MDVTEQYTEYCYNKYYEKSNWNDWNEYLAGYKAKKGYTFWEKDFDGMAYKTMLRQLISKWGIMSIDMQQAVEKDMVTINTDGTYEYVDNEEVVVPQEEPKEEIAVQNENTENEVSMNEL